VAAASPVPWWGWLAAGLIAGLLLVGIPALLLLARFLRDLDQATGWGGWSRRRR
jgi:hypothetical protein